MGKKFNVLKALKPKKENNEEEFLKGYEELTMRTKRRFVGRFVSMDAARTQAKVVLTTEEFEPKELIEQQLKINKQKDDIDKSKVS